MALRDDDNVLFFSFNFVSLFKKLSDIYDADISKCCPNVIFFLKFFVLDSSLIYQKKKIIVISDPGKENILWKEKKQRQSTVMNCVKTAQIHIISNEVPTVRRTQITFNPCSRTMSKRSFQTKITQFKKIKNVRKEKKNTQLTNKNEWTKCHIITTVGTYIKIE